MIRLRDPSWRAVVIFQATEIPFIFLLVLGWAELVNVRLDAVLGPALVLSALRFCFGAWHLRQLSRPASTWPAALEAGDHSALVAAQASLARLPGRFTLGYGLSWVSTYVVMSAWVWLGMAERAPLGHSELEATFLYLLSIFAGSAAFCYPVVSLLLAPSRVALSRAVAVAGLRSPPMPASLAWRLRLLIYAYVVAPVTFTLAPLWSNAGVNERYHGVLALAHAAEHERANLEAGRPLQRAVIVEATALPAAPGDSAALDELPTLERGARVSLDRRSHAASVALPLEAQHHGPERYLLVEGPIVDVEAGTELQLLVFVLIMLGFVIATSEINARSIGDPLRRIEEAMRRLVEVGELRELEHMPVLEHDEVGRLASSFNELVAGLEALAASVQTVAAGDLATRLEQSGDLPEAFRAMLAQLREMVVRIRATALDVASASAEIHAAARKQEQAAGKTSTSITALSTTIASLAAAAEQITESATGVLDNAEQTQATTDTMAGRIKALSTQTASITDLLEQIRDIADRSDLLALNGSLEATRAGEAGRGFALVASEMRRLAERVTATVADVRDQLALISASSSASVMATEQSRKLASDTAAAARAIFTVTQKQSQDTAGVSAAVAAVERFVLEATAATSQTRSTAAGLRDQVLELDRLTRQFRTGDEDGGVDPHAATTSEGSVHGVR